MPSANDAQQIILQRRQAVAAAMRRLPRILGNEGKNFFLQRFQEQAWLGSRIERWPARKRSKWGKKGRNRQGRALLVMTGRLRRSLRFTTSADTIRYYTDVPYARAHNEGFRGRVVQQVKEFRRIQTMAGVASTFGTGRQFRMGAVSSLKTRRERVVKVKTEVTVKAHKRTINQRLPQRRFMGDSPYLRQRLSRHIGAEIMRALKP